jgi:hypothetical protein
MNHEWANFSFDKYKKCKYKLFINKELAYFFVTTLHGEEECIEILKEKAKLSPGRYNKYFLITKTIDGKTTLLHKGTIKRL